MAEYIHRRLADVPGSPCPCGVSHRIITGADSDQVSIHRVSICKDARKHYHTAKTEYYVILSGSGTLELDDDSIDIDPGDVIMIPPGTRHVARGTFDIINIVSPPFDPSDEHEC